MGKRINKINKNKNSKKNNKKKDNKLIGIKEYNKENILIILLLIIFCVWGLLLLIRYFDYKNINRKIDKIEKLDSSIELLNDGYVDIENGVKKINDIKDKNNKLEQDVKNITSDIEELNIKISKYNK